MSRRPDSQQWLTAKAVGDRAEVAVGEWFAGRGYAVFKTLGLASFDLMLQATVEVKCDLVAPRSQHVAVEIECNGQPSGISTSEAFWWAFVVESQAIIIRTDALKQLIDAHSFRRVKGGDGQRTLLVLVPLSELKQSRDVFIVPLAGVA